METFALFFSTRLKITDQSYQCRNFYWKLSNPNSKKEKNKEFYKVVYVGQKKNWKNSKVSSAVPTSKVFALLEKATNFENCCCFFFWWGNALFFDNSPQNWLLLSFEIYVDDSTIFCAFFFLHKFLKVTLWEILKKKREGLKRTALQEIEENLSSDSNFAKTFVFET